MKEEAKETVEGTIVRYVAAGGVVVHESRVLVLFRSNRSEVRLPKGHVEPGEEIEAAALRETREESGYADLTVKADLGTQVVEFDYNGRHVVRTERYFLMTLVGQAFEPAEPVGQAFEPAEPVGQAFEPAEPVGQAFEPAEPVGQAFQPAEPVGQAFQPAMPGEAQFEPAWLTWDEALAALTFEAEREWVRRARKQSYPGLP